MGGPSGPTLLSPLDSYPGSESVGPEGPPTRAGATLRFGAGAPQTNVRADACPSAPIRAITRPAPMSPNAAQCRRLSQRPRARIAPAHRANRVRRRARPAERLTGRAAYSAPVAECRSFRPRPRRAHRLCGLSAPTNPARAAHAAAQK
ncbi:DUF6053 domain-containing protein [Lysobacter enzymogenes]|uniref:DUF6053 domain-containing protein n=1 Tax=Lysobacter enzymogenes TaxID=69 RepID=UPI003D18A7E2